MWSDWMSCSDRSVRIDLDAQGPITLLQEIPDLVEFVVAGNAQAHFEGWVEFRRGAVTADGNEKHRLLRVKRVAHDRVIARAILLHTGKTSARLQQRGQDVGLIVQRHLRKLFT